MPAKKKRKTQRAARPSSTKAIAAIDARLTHVETAVSELQTVAERHGDAVGTKPVPAETPAA